MTALKFFKYQGTGNDFVMIDNRNESFDSDNNELIGRLCDRRFGIGADGLILIQNHAEFDFEMIYINPDGTRSLCGNGSRCAVRFAHDLGIIGKETRFLTIEGPLHASIQDNRIHLSMPDVYNVSESRSNDFFINTGSPHFVRFVEDVKEIDVYTSGKEIRESDAFKPQGTNVNFVQQEGSALFVRTYERGVENETLSCGTGVTASALAAGILGDSNEIQIKTLGGNLAVRFEKAGNGNFKNIYLIGPAEKVFEGSIIL